MTAALRTTGLDFSYPGRDEVILSGIDIEFVPGQATALTGPSGRGKSTLLYLLGLLLTPTAGQVLVEGQATSGLSDAARSVLRARKMGFVFQDSELDPSRTVLDSVIEPALYAGGRRSDVVGRARELLDSFGVEARADHRPGQISGGQAQRVALCRALMNEPAIILADEPTGNLDHANSSLVLDHLLQAAHRDGATLVIATHDPFVVGQVDQVVEL